MRKEDWLKALRSGDQAVINFMFLYYKEKGGIGSPQQFSQMYPLMDVGQMVDKLNKEFGVNTLMSKEGSVINYY